MRSEKKSPLAGDEILIQLAGLPASEIEQYARTYRARVIGDAVADAIVWVARLARRLVEPMELGARKQRV